MQNRNAGVFRRSTLVLALVAGLAGHGVASANEQREAALEQRINELERQLHELMADVKAQRAVPVAAPPAVA